MANSITTNDTSTGGDVERTGSNYLAFALVLAFFFVGLTGVVVCHVLKKRGYRFTTAQGDEDYDDVFVDIEEKPERREPLDSMSENEDTVGNIIQCIMKNEANSDALNAMVPHTSIDSDIASSPPLTPVSPVSPPGADKLAFNQQHTIGGVNGGVNGSVNGSVNGGENGGENKWAVIKRSSQRKSSRRRASEVTVLSVGRFRVTKSDKSGKDRSTQLLTDSEGSYQSASAEVPGTRNSKVNTHSYKEESKDREER